MALNNIQLQPEEIEALYKDHLCNIEKPGKSAASQDSHTPSQVPQQGLMNKQILWLIEESKTDFLNETDLILLQKILHACRLQPDDIALVNCCRTSLSVSQLADQFQPELLILSGVSEEVESFAGSDFYEVLQANQLRVIKTDSFDAMGKDQSLKSRFWTTLRTLFQL